MDTKFLLYEVTDFVDLLHRISRENVILSNYVFAGHWGASLSCW